MEGQVMQDAVWHNDQALAIIQRIRDRSEQQVIESLQQTQAIVLQTDEGLRPILHTGSLPRQVEVDTPKRAETLQLGNSILNDVDIYPLAGELKDVHILPSEIILQQQCMTFEFRPQRSHNRV